MKLVTKTIDLTGVSGTVEFKYDAQAPVMFLAAVGAGTQGDPYVPTTPGFNMNPQYYGTHGNNEPADLTEAVQMVADGINGSNLSLNGVAIKALKQGPILTVVAALTDDQYANGNTQFWHLDYFQDPARWSTEVIDADFKLPDPNAVHTVDMLPIKKAATIAGAKFGAKV